MNDNIQFQNDQWRILDDIIESSDPRVLYEIDPERLSETTDRNGILYYDWPVHMAEKTWVDVDAFNEVFTKALHLFRVETDTAMLARSIAYSKKVEADR